MLPSRYARLIVSLLTVLTLGLSPLAFAAPASANAGVGVSGTLTTGSALTLSSSFKAPSSGAGTYILDTEVYGPAGNRVAQFIEQASLTSTSTTRKYVWDTTGLSTGKYRIAQGIFTLNWTANRSWLNQAGTVTLSSPTFSSVSVATTTSTTVAPAPTTTTTTAPAPTTTTSTTIAPAPTTTTTTTAPFRAVSVSQPWNLSSAVSGTGNVNVASTFVAASDFPTSNVILNTEIHNSSGTRVAQWFEQATVNAYQSATRNYAWSTADKASGTYTVKQGVFSSDWSRNIIWKDNSATINVAGATTATTTIAPVTSTTSTTTPITSTTSTTVPALAPSNSSVFWVDPTNPAARQAKEWQSSRPADAAYMSRIADGGAAVWLGGWNANVQSDASAVATAASNVGKIPVFVAYNIPGRDCGSYSAGGASGGDAYRTWIRSIAAGIGDKKAWVVLEPDAIPQLDCLSATGQTDRLALLSDAVSVLEAKPNVDVYLDAGHPGWHSAQTTATRLRSAGLDRARGFSLNVSNFSSTKDNVAYGESIASLTGKRYIVDTSRNGNGSNGEWCNPSGRALGVFPTTNTGSANADAFLWIKRPGESDGTCNGGPGAGNWWADYALGLAKSAWG